MDQLNNTSLPHLGQRQCPFGLSNIRYLLSHLGLEHFTFINFSFSISFLFVQRYYDFSYLCIVLRNNILEFWKCLILVEIAKLKQ